ncbi:uncharacterized protein LOC143920150 [Arctopsyche grandis]|uniref:uncharacterized protein LOC143920150 n=1 Tax=Arctopsyche grandis TaxID=121162 RepID=UPI00406D89E7
MKKLNEAIKQQTIILEILASGNMLTTAKSKCIKESVQRLLDILTDEISDKRTPLASQTQLFSEVAASSSGSRHLKVANTGIAAKSPSPAVIIYPCKDSGISSSEATQATLQAAINPTKIGAKVIGLKKVSNNGLVIFTNSIIDCELIAKCNEINLAKLNVVFPKKRWPKIIVKYVPRDVPDDRIMKILIEDFGTDVSNNIKFSHLAGSREGPTCHRVYSTSPALRKKLVNQGRCFIDWNSCRIDDYISVLKCSRCCNFGHSIKYCKEEKPNCSHCASSGHLVSNCPSTSNPPKCFNCTITNKPSNHMTRINQCPELKNQLTIMINKTDYGY